MEEWFKMGAADGFMMQFATLPDGLNDFVTLVVPELQRRGLFRTEYSGTTLREHLGLARPGNRFTQAEAAARSVGRV
jgi:N-acetyl-S-(2-succino)cysteine monooxygenase